MIRVFRHHGLMRVRLSVKGSDQVSQESKNHRGCEYDQEGNGREELLGLESKESQARVHLVQLPSDDESWKNLIKISSRVEGLVRKISSKEGNGRIVWLRRHDVLSVWLRRCIGRISSSRVEESHHRECIGETEELCQPQRGIDMMAKRIPRALMTTGNNFILRSKNSPSRCY